MIELLRRLFGNKGKVDNLDSNTGSENDEDIGCAKCGGLSYEHESYFDDYTCVNCGWSTQTLPKGVDKTKVRELPKPMPSRDRPIAKSPPQPLSTEQTSSLQGFDIETDMKCKRCGKAILSRGKFLKELNKHGLTLNPQTNSITVSGSFSGYSEVSNLQILAKELEESSAFKCNSCGTIYCLTCLFNEAPRHPTSGGKACFSCLGSISNA